MFYQRCDKCNRCAYFQQHYNPKADKGGFGQDSKVQCYCLNSAGDYRYRRCPDYSYGNSFNKQYQQEQQQFQKESGIGGLIVLVIMGLLIFGALKGCGVI